MDPATSNVQTSLHARERDVFPPLNPSISQLWPHQLVERNVPEPCARNPDIEQSTLICAAWALITSRLTGAEGMDFGVAQEGTVGSLSVDTDRGQTVRHLLQSADPTNRHLEPFHDDLVLQTVLIFQPSTTTSHMEFQATYPLTIQVCDAPDGTTFRATFEPRYLGRGTVESLLERIEFVMNQLLELDPQVQLSTVSTMTTHDLSEIWKWNRIVPPSINMCFHDLFRAKVQSRQDACAIDAWDGKLSYRRLDELSTQLAIKLIGRGVTADGNPIIPLLFDKSMWTTVALLGVLKAGGAFLLLDPSLPEKRLKYMVGRTKAERMLCGRSVQPLGATLMEEALVIEDELFDGSETSDKRLPEQQSSSLMYVVFTSGSTGVPKCVKTTHSNVTSALHYQLESLRFTESSRVFDFASYSFTTSICNATFTLAGGGCLCVPSEHDRRSRLAETMEQFQANLLDLTPSVGRTLDPLQVPSLQTLIFGGEYLQLGDVQRWHDRNVIHLYGQSECCSNSTINHTANTAEDTLHIGRGAGLITWIVDPDNHHILLPPGCVGELLFEGPLVSPGYLDEDPVKTRNAFVEDLPWLSEGFSPYASGRQGRLYKTGDLVKYREDGSLHILGRKDTQVKIRGQRVELGEVEHWIRACFPEASEVAVEAALPKGKSFSKTLLCFLQMPALEGTETRDDDEQRMGAIPLQVSDTVEERLLENLPHYMIPTVFFSLPLLPTTTTGKIDRKILRSIGSAFSADEIAQIASPRQGSKEKPTSPTEKVLQEVWSHILGVQKSNIGLDDNFFHLGGDSAAAMKVVGEARKLGISSAVADLFRHPRLRNFAKQSVSISGSSDEEIPPFGLVDHGNLDEFVEDIASLCGVEASSIEDILPCTALQQGLMSLSAKQPGAYMMQEVLELVPGISAEDLRRARDQVTRARSILRTRIVNHYELGFVQIVLNTECRLASVEGLDRYLETDKAQPMGFGDPLTRFAYITDGAGGHDHFALTIHHAICDGWTFELLVKDFYQAFHGLKMNAPSPFQNFIKYVKEQQGEECVSYWKEKLQGYSPIEFPGRPIALGEVSSHNVINHTFAQPTWKSKDITLATLAQAAWALVIGQMTGSTDVVFGVTVSGRKAKVPRIEIMVAPTFATVPFRIQFSKDKSISSFLQAVQEQGVAMIPYEQAGLHNIAKMSQDCQKACEFQSLLISQVEPTEAEHTDTIGIWRSANELSSSSSYALMLEVRPVKDQIVVKATFDVRLLDPLLGRRLLLRLEVMMKQLDCHGIECLGEIDSIIDEDLHQIWEWNKFLPSPSKELVHTVVRERAQAHPTKEAICAWDGRLTYCELDTLSDRLAGVLVDLGVGPNKLIPLCFEKSLWTPVAVLGVLKAGGGFLLLEPSLPIQRLSMIVHQLDSTLILSSSTNIDLCSQLTRTVVEVGPNSIPLDAAVPRLDLSPSAALFAVFTSGSTGTPKGITLSHSNFLTGVKHQSKLLGFDDNARVFDYAGYAFDIAAHNVLTTLVTGGCLCIPSEDDRRDPQRVSAAMVNMKVTIADLTPTVAQLIEPSAISSLEHLILAGEAVSLDHVLPWWGKVNIVNAYGPAECNISTVNGQASTPLEITGIGKGAGAVTWVVDPQNHGRLLPWGCVGELILEGPIVGRGYLNDPEKTALSFIDSPSWLIEGARDSRERNGQYGRLYKTGDLVKYLGDGSLVFIGRKDTQIKINGQRVELGEIESCIKQVINVKNVAAEMITLQDESERRVLAAFLQRRDKVQEESEGSALPKLLSIPSDIEDDLSMRLPVYMRPQLYFELMELPMTLTGKTDRRELRELGSRLASDQVAQIQSAGTDLDQPSMASDSQLQMRSIWSKILGLNKEHIRKEASFIQLGGDSISIMKLVSVVRKRGYELSVRDVFLRPRLEQMAEALDVGPCVGSNHIPKSAELGPVRLSFAQQRLWNIHMFQPNLSWPLMRTAVRVRGALKLEALSAAVHALEKRHSILRTVFERQDDHDMQSVRESHQTGFEVVDLSSRSDASLAHTFHQHPTDSFELARQPGWQITVYLLNETEKIISITTHRMISDGASLGILRQDLSSFYSHALRGTNISLLDEAPRLQYRDYAAWQRQLGHSVSRLSSLKERLTNSQAATFPSDKARPQALSGLTDTMENKVQGELFEKVQRFCKQQGVTLFVVLMAAFRTTHFLLTGVDDAVFGTIGANRVGHEVEDIVGPFEGVQCFRINAERPTSFTDVVHLVQAEMVSTMDMSFDRIIGEGFPETDKDLSRHPLVQMILVVHARPRAEVSECVWEGLETEVVVLPIVSRFDVEFHVYQEEECLHGVLVLSRDLYMADTGRSILSTFEGVLRNQVTLLDGGEDEDQR